MSTVIYNAYKLPRSTDLFALKQAVQPIRDQIHAAVLQEVVTDAIYECDNLGAQGKPVDFLRNLNKRLMDEDEFANPTKKLTGTHAVVFQRSTTGNRYIIFRGMFEKFTDRIALTPGLGKEYEYWDNTDRPGHVSDRAWQTRKQVWDELVAHRGLQAQGITMHFFDGFDASLPMAQHLFHNGAITLPSLDSRAKRYGLNLFLTDRADKDATNYVSQISRLMSDWSMNEVDQDIKEGYIATAHLQLIELPPYRMTRS